MKPIMHASFATKSLIILFIFACAAYVANAQTTTPQERFEQMQENAAERKTERQENVAERKQALASTTAAKKEERAEKVAERKAALSEKRQERIRNLAANIANRMDAAVNRLTQITDRIESRSDILSDRGVDTSSADALIADAKAHTNAAVTALDNIDTVVTDAITADDPKAAFTVARAEIKSIRDDLIAARDALKAAVTALKAAVSNANGNGVSDAVSNTASNETVTDTDESAEADVTSADQSEE